MSLISILRQRLGLERKSAHFSAGRYGAAWIATGDPLWTGRSYKTLVQGGYQRNVIVHRAVRLVAECAASVPLTLYENGRRLDEHPVLSLLHSPNPLCACASFLEEIYSYLLLAGNAYIEQVATSSGVVAELYTLRPDRMQIEPGKAGWPAAYIYESGGAKRRFPVHRVSGRSDILHIKNFNPLDDYYGLAALDAAAMGIDIHNAASGWNKALLDNAARPSGALVFEPGDGAPGNLTEEQVIRLKEEMAAQFQGAVNAGRPLLLEGGLKWQQMAFSPSDMDFINTKHVAAREIALAFGVPPMLLGIPGDNTYANYQEANRAFWRLTLLPLVDRVLGSLSRWLGGEGSALRLEADRDRITALAVEQDALWTRLGTADFMTTNEKRAEVGLDPVEGGDDGI